MKYFKFITILFLLVVVFTINKNALADNPSRCKENTIYDSKLEWTSEGCPFASIREACMPNHQYWYCCSEEETNCTMPLTN